MSATSKDYIIEEVPKVVKEWVRELYSNCYQMCPALNPQFDFLCAPLSGDEYAPYTYFHLLILPVHTNNSISVDEQIKTALQHLDLTVFDDVFFLLKFEIENNFVTRGRFIDKSEYRKILESE